MMGALRPLSTLLLLALLFVSFLDAQGTPPPAPLTLISHEGRRTVATTLLNTQELIALDDLAALFQVTVREDTLAGGLTATYKGRTIVVSPDQPIASVEGRLVTLPSPPIRLGRRWFVPVEFISRALAPIYDVRLELRRPSRLLLVGDVRVPRVTVRVDTPGPPTRATIEIAPSAPVAATIEGGRVVLRIDADALDATLPSNGGGLVEQVRIADTPTTMAVVVTGRAGQPRVTSATSDNVTRVAIEVPPAAGDTSSSPAAGPAAPAPRPPADAAPGSPRSPADAGAVPPLAASGSALRSIVIDPGHGGDDAGVRGSAGTTEKQITLDIARHLKSLIEGRLGIRVVLTREDDRTVELDQRAAMANNNKADLFLSVHLNGALAAAPKGAEIYYLALNRESEDARRAAEVDSVSLPVIGGGLRPVEVIRWDLAQARHLDQSAMLAGMLEDELGKDLPLASRPIREAPMRVLSALDMPAVLVETTYLTNPSEEKLVQTDGYQLKVAEALYRAIVRFRSHVESPVP